MRGVGCFPFKINPEPLSRRKRLIAPTEGGNKPNNGCELTYHNNSYTFRFARMRKMVLKKHNVEPCHNGDKCHRTVKRKQAFSQVGGAAVCLTVAGGRAALQHQHQHRAHGHKAPCGCPSRCPRSLHFPRRTGGHHPRAEDPR